MRETQIDGPDAVGSSMRCRLKETGSEASIRTESTMASRSNSDSTASLTGLNLAETSSPDSPRSNLYQQEQDAETSTLTYRKGFNAGNKFSNFNGESDDTTTSVTVYGLPNYALLLNWK